MGSLAISGRVRVTPGGYGVIMETMRMITNNRGAGPAPDADEALVEMFASAGITVTIVEQCDDPGCSVCRPDEPAKAA